MPGIPADSAHNVCFFSSLSRVVLWLYAVVWLGVLLQRGLRRAGSSHSLSAQPPLLEQEALGEQQTRRPLHQQLWESCLRSLNISTFHMDSNLTPILPSKLMNYTRTTSGRNFLSLTLQEFPPLRLLPGSNIPKYLPEVLKYRPFLWTLPAFLRFKPYTADLFKGLCWFFYYCLILRGQLNNIVQLPNSTLCLICKHWFSLYCSSEKKTRCRS